MSGKTSPAHLSLSLRSFYGESPPKRSRLNGTPNIRPAFKSLKDNLIKFERKLSEPIKSLELRESNESDTGEEPKSRDRESPLPLKNLGNTCYENSIIQCLFSLEAFMDNFEKSMLRVRRLVTPKHKSFEVASISENSNDEIASTKSTISPSDSQSTISEDDVRYRIADAFDKLYKCYTKRRAQLEADNLKQKASTSFQQGNHESSTGRESPVSEDGTLIRQSSAASAITSNQQSRLTPVESSSYRESNDGGEVADFTPTVSTSDVDRNTENPDVPISPNLTPIALVSSNTAPNDQAEIDTRLEDLKSAVGERSSQFNSTHQQDASEFFYHVIDSIQEFYQGLAKTNNEDNPVTKAFELELDYLIRCPKCHHKVITEEKIRTLPLALPFVNNTDESNQELSYNHITNSSPTPPNSDLGLDSPQSNRSEEQRNGSEEKENRALDEEASPVDVGKNTVSIANLELADKSESCRNESKKKHYTLRDALNNYFKDEVLDIGCTEKGCDSKNRTRKCLIRKLPQVLFITLARYSYTGKKNLDEIEAPFELSVPFRENKSPSHSPSYHRDFRDDDDDRYQLVAVVCHLGSSLNAGHYTSYVYNQNNSFWYSCDDDSITKVQEADVKNDSSKSGYCFFYVHKSCMKHPIQPKQKQEIAFKSAEQVKYPATSIIKGEVADSSVVMTPDSTPQSSPSPPALPQEIIDMHENHQTCMRDVDIIDDWA